MSSQLIWKNTWVIFFLPGSQQAHLWCLWVALALICSFRFVHVAKDENVKFYFSRSGFDYDCPLQDGDLRLASCPHFFPSWS